MRLAIYVPQRRARVYSPFVGYTNWEPFLRNVTEVAGGVTVLTGTGYYAGSQGFITEPVFIVEALIRSIPAPYQNNAAAYSRTWGVFREYAQQLLREGEESVLIVSGDEPTLIK